MVTSIKLNSRIKARMQEDLRQSEGLFDLDQPLINHWRENTYPSVKRLYSDERVLSEFWNEVDQNQSVDERGRDFTTLIFREVENIYTDLHTLKPRLSIKEHNKILNQFAGHAEKMTRLAFSDPTILAIIEECFDRHIKSSGLKSEDIAAENLKSFFVLLAGVIEGVEKSQKERWAHQHYPRKLNDKSFQKTFLILRFSRLIKRVYGKPKHKMTAAILSAVEPTLFPALTYADVAATIRGIKNPWDSSTSHFDETRLSRLWSTAYFLENKVSMRRGRARR